MASCTVLHAMSKEKSSNGGQTREQILHSVWLRTRCRAPLLPQSICTHEDWEVFDLNVAGCLACGTAHVCKAGMCRVEENKEGHHVCTITGCCIRMISFSEHEFVDHAVLSTPRPNTLLKDTAQKTMHYMPPLGQFARNEAHRQEAYGLSTHGVARVNKKNRYRSWVHQKIHNRDVTQRQLQELSRNAPLSWQTGGGAGSANFHAQQNSLHRDNDKAVALLNIIRVHVLEIICSSMWEQSMQQEIKRFDEKYKQHVLGAIRNHKSNSPSFLPIIPVLQSHVVHTMGRRRHVVMLPHDKRVAIAHQCAEIIHRHISLLNSICEGVVTEQKLKDATVGLLYLLRTGIVMGGIIVLPKVPILRNILPMETSLLSFFKVRGKCITITENIVKIVLRSSSHNDLSRMGASTISTLWD